MTNITKKIMRRVYVIWGVRYVLPRLDTNDIPKNSNAEVNEWDLKHTKN